MTKEELVSLLTKANISLDKWGTGKAKSVDHLFREIEAGETRLVWRHGLLRVVCVVGVSVHHVEKGETLYLREVKQMLADGRERLRDLAATVWEKRLIGESPEEAAYRGLREELGLVGVPLVSALGVHRDERKRKDSSSYPDLPTEYWYDKFCVIVPPDFFRPEGYKMREDGVTSHFEWEKSKFDPYGHEFI